MFGRLKKLRRSPQTDPLPTWVEGYNGEHTERVVRTILDDDGYRLLRGAEPPVIGDLVLYRDSDGAFTHIGMIVQVSTDLAAARFNLRVLSKWGQHGEYIHAEDDISPYMGSPTACYTDRK